MKVGSEVSTMPEWDKLALDYVKRRVGTDGALGISISDGLPAVAWHHYFRTNNMVRKAEHLRYRVVTGGSYTVPTLYPWQYDTAYPRREYDATTLGRSANVEAPDARARLIAGFESLARTMKGSGKADRFSADFFQRYCRSRKPGQTIDVRSKDYQDFCNADTGGHHGV